MANRSISNGSSTSGSRPVLQAPGTSTPPRPGADRGDTTRQRPQDHGAQVFNADGTPRLRAGRTVRREEESKESRESGEDSSSLVESSDEDTDTPPTRASAQSGHPSGKSPGGNASATTSVENPPQSPRTSPPKVRSILTSRLFGTTRVSQQHIDAHQECLAPQDRGCPIAEQAPCAIPAGAEKSRALASANHLDHLVDYGAAEGCSARQARPG